MKSRLHKFFAILMCCMIAILFVGCGGNDSNFYNDLKQQLDNGEITEEEFLQKRMDAMSVPLYGSKVLYRPPAFPLLSA